MNFITDLKQHSILRPKPKDNSVDVNMRQDWWYFVRIKAQLLNLLQSEVYRGKCIINLLFN